VSNFTFIYPSSSNNIIWCVSPDIHRRPTPLFSGKEIIKTQHHGELNMKKLSSPLGARGFISIILFVLALLSYKPVIADESESATNISISNVWSGALIVVWATSSNNWLWGYTPYDAKTFGENNNWSISYNSDSTVSFKNIAQGTCMVAYSEKGLTHNTCDNQSSNQKFQQILTGSGAVQLRSQSLGQCVTADESANYKYAFFVHFTPCASQGEEADSKQLWVLNPATRNAKVAPDREF